MHLELILLIIIFFIICAIIILKLNAFFGILLIRTVSHNTGAYLSKTEKDFYFVTIKIKF